MLPNPFSPSTTLATFLSSLRHQLTSPPFRTFTSFLLLGLLNNILYVILLSAALDLVGPSVPKGLVLLFDVLPSLLVKAICPYFLHRIGYGKRVWACTVLAMAGMALVAASPDSVHPTSLPGATTGGVLAKGKEKVEGWLGKAGMTTTTAPPPARALGALEVVMKLGGIALASLSSGVGESSFIALTSRYGRNALAAWGSGTGAAGLVGAGAYVLATTTLGFGVRGSLVAFACLPLGLLGAYYGLLPREGLDLEGTGAKEGYAPVRAAEEDGEGEAGGTGSEGRDELEAAAAQREGLLAQEHPISTVVAHKETQSFLSNMKLARSLVLPYMLPIFLVYLAEYTINQGIASTLLFPLEETPFSHYREFYPTYTAIYQLGVFVSRSSLPFVRIQALYLPSFLQVGNLILFVFQALYFTVIPSVWVVFLVIFWEGLLGGIVYISTFRRIGEELAPADREFSLALTTVSDSAGICLASFVGMVVETKLCKWQVGHGRDWCRRL